MYKEYNNLRPSEQFAIAKFLAGETIALHAKFDQKLAHAYFSERYPDAYKYHLQNAKKEVCCTFSIIAVGDNTIRAVLLTYFSSDAERYDDSQYQKLETPADPTGIILDIPLEIIDNLSLSTTKTVLR